MSRFWVNLLGLQLKSFTKKPTKYAVIFAKYFFSNDTSCFCVQLDADTEINDNAAIFGYMDLNIGNAYDEFKVKHKSD